MPAERPFTARSVVASTLLGVDPPVLPVRVLVRSGELFGIAEGTTRVALSRMVTAGELAADGDGRYRLEGHLLARQRRQRESRRPHLRRWDGDWRIAIVAAERRPAATRAALRDAMHRARLAELREGVWTRPDNLEGAVEHGHGGGYEWATARFDDPARVVKRLWDLRSWSLRARALVQEMERWTPRLDGGDRDALAPTFVLSAAVLRHFQADPLLPDSLLPDGWPGRELRDAYDEFDRSFASVWRDWHRSAFGRAQNSDVTGA